MCYVFVTLYALFIFFIYMDKEIIEISKCDTYVYLILLSLEIDDIKSQTKIWIRRFNYA